MIFVTPKRVLKERNKALFKVVRETLETEVFPALYRQGWIKSPFKSSYFGAAPHGFSYTLFSFCADNHFEMLDFEVMRHWSGYAHSGPNIQIEYLYGALAQDGDDPQINDPDFPVNVLGSTELYRQREQIHAYTRNRFPYCVRPFGIKSIGSEVRQQKNIEQFRREIIDHFSDVSDFSERWRREKRVLRVQSSRHPP